MIEYSKALTAMDTGNKAAAKESLKKVIAEAPDFQLAQIDLDKMTK